VERALICCDFDILISENPACWCRHRSTQVAFDIGNLLPPTQSRFRRPLDSKHRTGSSWTALPWVPPRQAELSQRRRLRLGQNCDAGLGDVGRFQCAPFESSGSVFWRMMVPHTLSSTFTAVVSQGAMTSFMVTAEVHRSSRTKCREGCEWTTVIGDLQQQGSF